MLTVGTFKSVLNYLQKAITFLDAETHCFLGRLHQEDLEVLINELLQLKELSNETQLVIKEKSMKPKGERG